MMWCFCLSLILTTVQESSWSLGIWTKCQPSPSRRALGARLQSMLTELSSQRNGINNSNIQRTDWGKSQIHRVIWAKSSDFRPQFCVLGRGAAQCEGHLEKRVSPLTHPFKKLSHALWQRLRPCLVCPDCPSEAFLEFGPFSLSAVASPCGSSQSLASPLRAQV